MSQSLTQHSIQPCCVIASRDTGTRFCNECGSCIDRCPAFEACGGLLDSDGHCLACIAPEIRLETGVRHAAIGDSLTLPITVSNASPTGRPLIVKGIWIRHHQEEWRAFELPWDRLNAGETKPVTLTTDILDRAGSHRIEILISVATRWQWREETYAFSTGLEVNVENEKDVVVQQNIHYAADAPQTGATIYAPVRVTSDSKSRRDKATSAAQILSLIRANVCEHQFGWRGSSDGLRVSRRSNFSWLGFSEMCSPDNGPIDNRCGTLTFGRLRTKQQDGPCDVRLLAFHDSGQRDETTSQQISRDQFCLCIANDRLLLRVNSNNGVWVDGQVYPQGEFVTLKHGSQISPFQTNTQRIMLTIGFQIEHSEVVGIKVTR